MIAIERCATSTPVAYGDLPPRYHRWKWQVLICFLCLLPVRIYRAVQLLAHFAPDQGRPAPHQHRDRHHQRHAAVGFHAGRPGAWTPERGLRAARLGDAGGDILTTVFNWAASFGTSALTFAIPWGLAGFVNAACWSPGHQHDQPVVAPAGAGNRHGNPGHGHRRRDAADVVAQSSWVAAEWGWRAAFRYPPLMIAALGIAFYFADPRPSPGRRACPSTSRRIRFRQSRNR